MKYSFEVLIPQTKTDLTQINLDAVERKCVVNEYASPAYSKLKCHWVEFGCNSIYDITDLYELYKKLGYQAMSDIYI
jgi:hypothetical protein